MIKTLNNKKIAILGLGIENQAFLEYLKKKDLKNEYHLFDMRNEEDLSYRLEKLDKNNIVVHESNDDNDLSGFDIILRSPGYPLFKNNIVEASKRGVEVSSPMKMFFSLCPSKNIIGVTGSKGKGTTSSLIYRILKSADFRVFLGGNIGVAPFSFVEDIKEGDYVILELSSFQLEDIDSSPHIAVVTNLSEEHLKPADPMNPNYHKSMDDYTRAKLNILKFQSKGDFAVLNEVFKDKPLFFSRGREEYLGKAKRVYFAKSELQSKLVGKYNKENIAAAVEVAKILGIKLPLIKRAVANFKGLPHRIEYVREVMGVKYYDNSLATTPEATIADINSFIEPIVLFLGGADKGSSFKNLAKEISKKNVKFVILLQGESSNKINQELLASGFPSHKIKETNSMSEGVRVAKEQSRAGDIVLLSTACASFGMFKNYKERGEKFQKEVNNL